MADDPGYTKTYPIIMANSDEEVYGSGSINDLATALRLCCDDEISEGEAIAAVMSANG